VRNFDAAAGSTIAAKQSVELLSQSNGQSFRVTREQNARFGMLSRQQCSTMHCDYTFACSSGP
jgi:hypothetical protein